MAFIEFDYLPFYISCELDAYFRFVFTTEKLIEKFQETLNWFVNDAKGWEVKRDTDDEIYHKSVELDPVHGYASDWNTTNLKYFMGSIVSQESYFPWYFNENINGWDVSNVINMRSAFGGCKVFNQPLDLWDVSNVEEMGYMFFDCFQFNQPLSKWNVSKVEDMSWMFDGCSQFNQSVNDWNISNVKEMERMFQGCSRFKQSFDNWNVSHVENRSWMFKDCAQFQ
jgi:surface protein